MKPVGALIGLGLAGYGLLVLVGVIAHEALLVGALSLGLGVALTLFGLPLIRLARGRIVAAIGAVAAIGVVTYNLLLRSSLSLPEWAILIYGAALVVAAPFLSKSIGRLQVGTMVAWSFPIVLAPLSMFALHALLTPATGGGSVAAPVVHALVVAPTAFLLQLIGTPVALTGNNMVLATPRGTLVLGVGLVCAGLYPMALFAGMVGLHAWQRRLPPRRIIAYLGTGLAALWFLNLMRLVILTKVGQAHGGTALQQVHAHLGWILFALFTMVYWGIVLGRIEAHQAPQAART